jgi:L-malate glycosyltransferase
VLPHPGGGGETYVDALAEMDGYEFERVYLAPSAKARGVSILRAAAEAQRSARKHDLLHVHGEVASALCLVGLALRPSVVTLHGLNLLRRLTGVARLASAANLRLIVNAATRTICVSEAERDDVLGSAGTRAAKRLIVIHNGIAAGERPNAAERSAVRAELGLAAETIVGISVGSLDPHKDPLVPVRAALEVAREGKPLTLLVAGDGPLRPEMEQVARDGGLDAVRPLGFRTDVRRLLAGADFFVLSSQREGLSYAVLEAMSLGLPAVVSDAPGNPEAVGDAGIVVKRGDVAGFAGAFRRLIDVSDRAALGEAARERVARHFRLDEMVRRTRLVYDEVAAQGSPATTE